MNDKRTYVGYWSYTFHPVDFTQLLLFVSLSPVVGYGSWFEHVQEFWEHRMDSNVLFLKYEDMYKVTDHHCPVLFFGCRPAGHIQPGSNYYSL